MSTKNSRILALDGLRFIAILLVLTTHAVATFGLDWLGGGIGVDMFFVLSGYLIAGLLSKELDQSGTINLRNFNLKRLIRLWPALLSVVVVMLLPGLVVFKSPTLFLENSLAAATYTYPIFSGLLDRTQLAYGPMWTLGLEMYFYIIFPLVLLLLTRMRFSKKTLACSMIAIGGVSATVVAVAGFLTDGNLGVFGYLRVGALAIGVGLSLSENTIAKFFGKKFFGTIGSLVLATAILISFKTQFLGLAFSLGALATVFLITSIRHSESDQWLKHLMSQKQIVYIGQISYEIYLWHGVLREVMEVVFEGNGILTIIAAYGLTMILSAVTHKALAPLQRRMLSAWVLNK